MDNRQGHKDLANYQRKGKRVHYACGHHADFRLSSHPEVGDWMICRVCGQETAVESIEAGIKRPMPKEGSSDPVARYSLHLGSHYGDV